MNIQLKTFARQTLKDGLAGLPERWQRKFKLIYGRKYDSKENATRSIEETEQIPIKDIVDEIPEEYLDRAMQQVSNSIRLLEFQTKNENNTK